MVAVPVGVAEAIIVKAVPTLECATRYLPGLTKRRLVPETNTPDPTMIGVVPKKLELVMPTVESMETLLSVTSGV